MLSLIISAICIAAYLLFDPMQMALKPADFHWWQLATYGFAHAGSLHLVLNLLALLSFGPPLERTWGRGRFVAAYATCLVAGGLAQLASNPHPIVGASAGIFGLFAAFVMANPRRRVVSVFVIELPAWIVLALYSALSVLALLLHWATGIGHAAHLAGVAAGVLLAMKKPR